MSTMLFDTPDVEREYERFRKEIGESDPYASSETLGIQDVLKAHFLIADFFYQLGAGMGGLGPRSIDMLHSAVARQSSSFAGASKWSNRYEVCATLFYGLIMNHPFHDANKRTAFLSALYLLEKMGRCLTAPQKHFEDFAVEVADRQLDKYDRYKKLKKTDPDPEIRFIAEFFKRNTREFDKRFYAVTFHQLNTILHRYKCGLENPNHNRIDVVRYERKRRFFGDPIIQIVKLGQIGFPSWTAQVGQGAIRTVRQVTSLDYEHQVDSQEFFHGVDPLSQLITSYQEPLRRLANR